MAVLGVVAEFNPFHNGHLKLIEKVQSQHNFAAVICVMSGSFTQRGEPAICNKWSRAQMALLSGVDLIIELPFCFASRSAYNFAKGAIQLLEHTGVVTHLAFASESNNITTLNKVATLLNNEPDQYKSILKNLLDKGLSYPVARSESLQKYLDNPSIEVFLKGSNNILAIEYLRVLAELNSSILPITIKRKGADYHNKELSKYASASAIRNALYKKQPLSEISYALPLSSSQILKKEIETGRTPISLDNFENAILSKLRTMDKEEVEKLHDVTEGLESRIIDKSIVSTNLEELKLAIKSRRYSLTRINRILLYSLFNLTKDQTEQLDSFGPMYHHVLGFNKRGIKILEKINRNSKIPVLNRGKDVKAIYNQQGTPAKQMIKLDVMSTNLYNLFYPNYKQRIGGADFTTSPIRDL
ncbi:MAG TPA: nucleotidyltransferase [Syntrophomonadaceae bacterium]|nr:nucleotidyltransferase [Syntrophomonadaceae bacterium]